MFYTWLHIAYAVLLCAAMWFNRGCWRTFLLSLVVAACIFVPVPWENPISLWYFKQSLNELLVIIAALTLRSRATWAVIVFSAILALIHLMGMIVGPVDGIGPYRVAVPLFETGKLLVCVVLSHSALKAYERRALRTILEGHHHD